MYLDKTFSNDLFYGYYGRGYKRLIVTTPSYVMDPTITITATGYTQISNSITVLEGTSVSYTVSAVGYQTVSDTVTVDDNGILEVDMEELMVTLTVNATPSGATVTLTSEGYEQSGNTITIQQGKPVRCVVSATGYDDYSFSMILMENTTISVPLAGYRLTIDPTPAEANVQLTASGYAQSGNLILVSSGTSVTYTVSAEGYDTITDTVQVTEDITKEIVLEQDFVQPTLTENGTPGGDVMAVSWVPSADSSYGVAYTIFEPNDGYIRIYSEDEPSFLKVNIYFPKPTRLTYISFKVVDQDVSSGNAVNTKLYAGTSMGDTSVLIKDIGTVNKDSTAQISTSDLTEYYQYYALYARTLGTARNDALVLSNFLLQGRMHDIVS